MWAFIPLLCQNINNDNRGRDECRIFYVRAFYLDALIRLVRRDRECRITEKGWMFVQGKTQGSGSQDVDGWTAGR